jgi:ORF6N domain
MSAEQLLPLQSLIGSRILVLREQRVMLDAGLAGLYDVPTKALVQAVKRNPARFPADFMFQLSTEEFVALRSQTVTSNAGRGGRRTAPYAFTEQGVTRPGGPSVSSRRRSPGSPENNADVQTASAG